MVNLDKSVLIETSDAFVLGLSGLSLIDVALYKGWSRETYEKVQINIQLINKARDNSDVMTDYFDVNYYLHLHLGKWDKPMLERK